VAANYDYPLIKLYTNQGVYGLGEVRDAGVEGIALIFEVAPIGEKSAGYSGYSCARFVHTPGMGAWAAAISAIDMALA